MCTGRPRDEKAERQQLNSRFVFGHARHRHIGAHAAFARRLAHGAVLAGERPDDAGVGARGREPFAVMRPGEAARLAGIAGHAHVLGVGDAPAVQRIFLHGGDEKAPVGRDSGVDMGTRPGERLRLAGVGEPERRAEEPTTFEDVDVLVVRRDQLQGPRIVDHAGAGNSARARQRHRHHFSGADDLAQPAPYDRETSR